MEEMKEDMAILDDLAKRYAAAESSLKNAQQVLANDKIGRQESLTRRIVDLLSETPAEESVRKAVADLDRVRDETTERVKEAC